jgi:tetratricopeptide (TPR) repeat protein
MRAVLIGGAIALLAIIVHIPAMRAGWIWDDDSFLHNNPIIKAPDGLRRFWFTTQAEDYFPLTYSMLWAEWRLWDGKPPPFHVVNILLHAGAAVLLWRVLKRLNVPAAWLGGLLFAVHPVATSSVAWVAERKNTLSMVFYLAAALACLRFEDKGRWWRYLLALGLFLLALFSKSSVVVLPPALLLCAWWRRGRIAWLDVKRLAPFFVAALLFGLVEVHFHNLKAAGIEPADADLPSKLIHKEVVARPEGMLSRTAAAGWAVWFYLGKDLFPHPLMMVYPRWNVDPARPLHWLPLALLLFTFAVLWRYRASWGKGPLFALAYFVLALGPVLGFFDISFMEYSLVADHWQYIALPGFVGLLAGLAGRAWAFKAWRPMVGTATALALIALFILAWEHAGVYRNQETLWTHNLRYRPFPGAYTNLGVIKFWRGDLNGAIKDYRAALDLDPDFSAAAFNLAGAYMKLSEQPNIDIARRRELLDLAVHYFNERVKRNADPGSVRALESAKRQREALGN